MRRSFERGSAAGSPRCGAGTLIARIAVMPRFALSLAAALALAAPATAAADRPEWTDCTFDSLPRTVSMQKAFTTGIPAAFTCKSAEKAFLPVRISDPKVRLTSDQKLQ